MPHVFSYVQASVSLLLSPIIFFLVCATFPVASSMIVCLVSRFSPCPSSFFYSSLPSGIQFLLHHFWPPSCPFLPSPPRREVIRSLTFLNKRANRIMVPRIPRLDIVVYMSFIRCPSWPNKAIQLRRPSSPSLFQNRRCVKAISFSRPQLDHVDVTLQFNSFIIPYHISFLNPPWSFPHPCQHKGQYISLSSSVSSSSVRNDPSSTMKAPVM